jgi:hypothetical protein
MDTKTPEITNQLKNYIGQIQKKWISRTNTTKKKKENQNQQQPLETTSSTNLVVSLKNEDSNSTHRLNELYQEETMTMYRTHEDTYSQSIYTVTLNQMAIYFKVLYVENRPFQATFIDLETSDSSQKIMELLQSHLPKLKLKDYDRFVNSIKNQALPVDIDRIPSQVATNLMQNSQEDISIYTALYVRIEIERSFFSTTDLGKRIQIQTSKRIKTGIEYMASDKIAKTMTEKRTEFVQVWNQINSLQTENNQISEQMNSKMQLSIDNWAEKLKQRHDSNLDEINGHIHEIAKKDNRACIIPRKQVWATNQIN